MIVRIMGEGQFELDEHEARALNDLDTALDASVDAGPEGEFAVHLAAMQAFVRDHGRRVADDEIVASDCIVPPPGISLDELRALLGGEGLVPDQVTR